MWDINNRYLEEVTEGGEGAAPAEEVSNEALLDAAEPELGENEYFLIDGVKGTGERPEWYKADKYKSIAEQARAYTELEKKFGSFTGAPKDGYELPEGLSKEDALVQEVLSFGEKTGLSQGGFNDLMELALAQADANQQISREAEMQKLGDQAGQRIKQVEAFLKHKAGSQYEEISQLVKDADSVMLVESIMKLVQPPKLPIDGVQVDGAPTWEDIQKEMFRKDENGQLLRSVSREHEMKIQRMMKEYGGDKPNRQVVG